MISRVLYWPLIIYAIHNKVTNCDTCKFTKQSNTKYGEFPAKESEEITWNKLCVDITSPYVIRITGKKLNLHLKAVTITDPVTGCFEIVQYDDKIAISIVKLLELCGYLYTLYQKKSCMTKDQNLLITSS